MLHILDFNCVCMCVILTVCVCVCACARACVRVACVNLKTVVMTWDEKSVLKVRNHGQVVGFVLVRAILE